MKAIHSARTSTSFYRLVTAAINDIMVNGYSQKRMESWLEQLAIAAEGALMPIEQLERLLHARLLKVFTRATSDKRLFKVHKGISPYTLASIKPKLHALLEERIRASVDLIKLNREKVIPEQLGRFAGWCSSVPVTGIPANRRVKTRKEVRRGIAGLSYNSRLVQHDQAHKLVAAVNELVATDGGAIALIWNSHWREIGYDFRPSHKARDEKVYGIRNSWAHLKGLIKAGKNGWYDQITAVAEEVACRCYGTFLYSVSECLKLAPDMVTEKGRAEVKRVQSQISAWKSAA